jgi:hypothetical protein
MTTPATTVTVEPGAIAGLTVERRRREPTPTVRPALANRAAGRLRADAAATAPEDVGFAETHYKRTTQDDAEVAAYQAATTQGASARARPAEPEPELDAALIADRPHRPTPAWPAHATNAPHRTRPTWRPR